MIKSRNAKLQRTTINKISTSILTYTNKLNRASIKINKVNYVKPAGFFMPTSNIQHTTWIWNLHADAHDLGKNVRNMEDISRSIFSAHFAQLSIICIWLSGMYLH